MSDVLNALTALAKSVFRERSDATELTDRSSNILPSCDPVLKELQRESLRLPTRHPDIDDVVRLALSQPEMAVLAPREGELAT